MNRKRPVSSRQVISYLRVSTVNQDTEKNKADVLKFANDRKFGPVEFVEEQASGKKKWTERKIKGIIDRLKQNDILIVPELSRLSRSLKEILEIIEEAKKKDIIIYAIKGNWELNGTLSSKMVAWVLSMVSEIERDLMAERVTEGLKAAKARGVKLGRPKGPGKSRLDQYRPEIEALLANGSKKSFIAKRYGVTPATLHNWLNRHNIKVTAKP